MIAQKELTFRMFNVGTQRYESNLYPEAMVDEQGHLTFLAEPTHFIMEQSTGQKDANNKKIFENDVLESEHGAFYRIMQIDGKYVFFGKDGKYHFDLLKERAKHMKIVGTVHDTQFNDFVINE